MKSKPNEKTFSSQKARQGEIILRTPIRRIIFVAGLLGFVVMVGVLGVLLS